MKALALALIALPALADEPVVPKFAAEQAGVTASYTGEWEQMVGGGVAVFDCDGDRKLDMVIAGGTSPASLWKNDGTPGNELHFSNIKAGVEETGVSGVWPIDIDGDGIRDLVMLRVGEDVVMKGLGACRFRRANEDWGFQGGDGWSTAFSATFEPGADWPTLAVGDYIDRTQDMDPWGSCTDNHLYRPEPGARRFAAPLPLKPSFCALSMLFTDWNHSGRASLRVSNDREYYLGGQEQLWHLDPGQPPRLYTEAEGWQRLRIWGMGIAEADLNADGYPEFFLTSMADSKLQTLAAPGPDAKPAYKDVAFAKGVTAHRPYTGGDKRPSTGWHAQFEDVNNDGLIDLFVAKGNVWDMPDFAHEDPNNLLLQRADGTFAEAGDKAGVASMLTGRGAALADLNGDGALDLVVVNRNGPAEIWLKTGALENGVAIDLTEPRGNRDAMGAVLEVRTGDHLQRREVTVGGGQGGGVLAPIHFGLGQAAEAEVRVTWPGDAAPGDWVALGAGSVWQIDKAAAPPVKE